MSYLVLLALLLPTVADHAAANPVYAKLVEQGLEIADQKVKFAEPTMPDGLSAADQKKIISVIGGDAYDYDSMIRESTVAPHIVREDLVEKGKARYRTADFWFVAYGKLDALTDKEVLDRMLDPSKEEGSSIEVTNDDLKKIGITLNSQSKDHEGYGHVNYVLEKRVDLALTGRAFWSQTDDSIVATVLVDPRFAEDKKLASVWRPITRDDAGNEKVGDQQPYSGMAMYLKVTRLKDVEDGLFVECHLIFNEPAEWFDGRNYLGSKLPPIISKQVRTMRAELAKASQ